VVVIQRVRVRWSAAGRGAIQASMRCAVPDAYELPVPASAPVVAHDALAGEVGGYQPAAHVLAGHDLARAAGSGQTLAAL
jgi:hypothetical protein